MSNINWLGYNKVYSRGRLKTDKVDAVLRLTLLRKDERCQIINSIQLLNNMERSTKTQ